MSDNAPYPRGFNHIGVSVPNVEDAVKWYRDVLGFRLISGPNDIESAAGAESQAQNVLGSDFRKMRMAHLVTSNGIGVELFEIIDPPHQPASDRVEYNRGGIFHFCVTDPDVEGLADRIVATGGNKLSKIWQERPDDKSCRMIYCADPFGIVIEIYSHSYDAMQSWRADAPARKV